MDRYRKSENAISISHRAAEAQRRNRERFILRLGGFVCFEERLE
jgi:hypothetical protein